MKNIIRILLFTIILGTSSSCSKDYLDVSDELAGGLNNVDQVFDNAAYTRRWYANVFTGIPDYYDMVHANWDAGGQTGLHNPWTGMTDEIHTGYGDNNNYPISFRNSSNMGFHRWNTLYALIRQANIFLEKAKVIPASGVNADKLLSTELDPMIVNVKFMRAYYHYLLLEQYGPVPIMDRSYDAKEDLDVPRSSVDEVINFIDTELLRVIPLLPQTPAISDDVKALPTKGAALAVRGKLWIHAASPLLNGGFTEALALANTDGKKLFPAANPSIWNKAVEVLKELIDYANAGNHQLYKNSGAFDPAKSVYELFQVYNSEIIWATSVNGSGGLNGDRWERRATPRSETNGLGSTAVLQELVDDFYMKDGKPIKATSFLPASTAYSETGTSLYTEAVTATAPYASATPTSVNNMYINREPRFYNTVFFAGRRWHVSNKVTNFYVGTPNDRSVAPAQYTASGYLLYKRYNRTVSLPSPGLATRFRPSIIFRLAEFYLLYAEALNEVNPGSPDVLNYVNLVRERAGLPKLEVLNPGIIGNQTLQREAIRRESRIELATEGQRYFDVRRWMIAEAPEGRQAGDFSGMNMAGNATTFFQRTNFQTRIFERKQYLYPIPFSEMQKSKNLVQNWGW
jgi:hypothetical protein